MTQPGRKTSKPYFGQTVGILGGGQLARMLAESAHRLGLRPVVQARQSFEPACQVCAETELGPLESSISRLLSRVSTVIFENEFVSCDVLAKAAAGRAEDFVPGIEVLRVLQDKLRQKELLAELKIPSAPFIAAPEATGVDWSSWLKQVDAHFSSAFVLKWAQQGYDGKGTWIAQRAAATPKGGSAVDLTSALAFCRKAESLGVRVYAEAKVDFKQELAIVAAYSTQGEFANYPLVISEQEDGICRKVIGPAVALGVAPALEQAAASHARAVAERLRLYGCFAIEFFETSTGALWVNELAPRVHNTGHYTQDASRTSQFENHWRAVLGLPLGSTESAPGFVMLNLLGPPGVTRSADAGEKMEPPPLLSDAHLHWYGKLGTQPGRKLGHLNGVVSDVARLPELVARLEQCEQEWAGMIERGE